MRESLQYVAAKGLYDVTRGKVSSRNSFIGFSFFFYFFYCSAKNRIFKSPPFNPPNPREGRKREQDGWSAGGLPHSDRTIFHEDMTKEGCRNDVAVNLGESISVSLQSVGFTKSYIRLRYFIKIDCSSPHPGRCSSEINNYVCCTRNIGRLINRLSAFAREDRESRY